MAVNGSVPQLTEAAFTRAFGRLAIRRPDTDPGLIEIGPVDDVAQAWVADWLADLLAANPALIIYVQRQLDAGPARTYPEPGYAAVPVACLENAILTTVRAGTSPVRRSEARSCRYCGAAPERPNRQQRRVVARRGARHVDATVRHTPFCPRAVGGGTRVREGGRRG